MSRVNSARIAAIKAEHAKLEVRGAIMASDAFFPFRDGIDNAADVVAGFQATLEKWQGIVKEVGDDEEAFVERMMSEVYSKM